MRRTHVLSGLVAVSAIAAFSLVSAGSPATAFDPSKAPEIQDRILSGLADYELRTINGESVVTGQPTVRGYAPTANSGCGSKVRGNVKVNQNCLNIADTNLQGRAQAQNETSIARNPMNTQNVIASYNDYRRGDGTCGTSYSTNGGQTWSDSTVPNGFTRGAAFGGVAREYWQAAGDTSVAWDTKGNAYLSCQVFMRGASATNNPDASSAFYVFRSTGNYGASWNFVGRPVAQDYDTSGSSLLDKQLMTVDNHVGSPFQDRVYVTWTLFDSDGTAYIYEGHSSDYGRTFSTPVLVSSTSSLCPNAYGLPTPQGTCNENQFSQPFTGPDGALYVTWANFNNPVSGNDNRNQMLLAKSTDGGATFGAPVKVGDYYDLPDCATYQAGADAGRACVPEKGSARNSVFRASNYPVGAVNPTSPSTVAVTFGSYINKNSNESNGCVPDGFSAYGINTYTGVKTAGACNNDILVSVSTDGGQTFTGTTTDPRQLGTVTQSPGQATTDQFWQWADFTSGGKLAVSYYDRQYGNDETTGSSDITVSGSSGLITFGNVRATSTSMPVPTQFPDANGNSQFYGDYAGLTAAGSAGTALPFWSDTRDPDLFSCSDSGAPTVCTGNEPTGVLANDENAYTASVTVPGP